MIGKETLAQMKQRHQQEERTAIEQHEIRMRTLRERHFSEIMQCPDQAGRSDTNQRRKGE